MKHEDKRREAEAFIDKVIAPARKAEAASHRDHQARAKLQREERQAVVRALDGSGFDTKQLDALAEARSTSRKLLAEEDYQRAIDLSDAAARRLADLGQFIFPADPTETVIDQVTFIRSFADQGSLFDSNIAPGDNWARYRVKGTSDLFGGSGRLSFFTLWQNPLDANAIVTPRTSLSVNARLSCDADWSGVASWFGLDSKARGTVHARTTIWGMDSSQRSVVDDREIGNVSVSGGFFGDDASRSIAFGDVLQGSGVVVVPRAYMLFEVEVVTDWDIASDASVTFDAESGSHRVSLSQLVLGGVPPQQPSNIILSVTVQPVAGGGSVTLNWTGANGARVDIYQNNVKVGDTENDGTWNVLVNSGSYQFRVCEMGTANCSNTVSVTVP